MKLSITLDTFPTRIMKRSVRRQPLRRIFAVLQLVGFHQSPSRSCDCSSNSWNTARPWISVLLFCNVLSFCPDDKTIPLSSLPRCFHISHYHGIFLQHCSYSAQCHIFEWLPDMQHWYTGCPDQNVSLAFLYLLCPLPVTKLGFYFSDRWHFSQLLSG